MRPVAGIFVAGLLLWPAAAWPQSQEGPSAAKPGEPAPVSAPARPRPTATPRPGRTAPAPARSRLPPSPPSAPSNKLRADAGVAFPADI